MSQEYGREPKAGCAWHCILQHCTEQIGVTRAPAFLTLVLFTLVTLSSILLALFTGAKPSTMRTFLQHTSAGRFLTLQSQASQSSHSSYGGHSPSLHDDGYSNSPTKIWVKGVGKELSTLGADGWIKNAQLVYGHEGKESGSMAYARVPGEDERM